MNQETEKLREQFINLPVDPPAKRTQAEPLTTAFIAMGARDVYLKQFPDYEHAGGFIGFIEEVTDQTLLLDKVADYFDERGAHSGVFLYDVAEEFGDQFGVKVVEGMDDPRQTAKEILYTIMINCAYDEELLVEAFKGA